MTTIKDVARAANVSPATVSYVLNQSAPVREETRVRVLAAVAALGYQPHQQARNLQRQRTATLGLVLNVDRATLSSHEVAFDLGPLLLQCVLTAAQAGYSLLVVSPSVAAPTGHGLADGWIMLDAQHTQPGPRIWATWPPRNDPAPAVICDGAAAAERAVVTLRALGRSRIALITPPAGGTDTARWYLGYRRALRRAGLAFDPTLVIEPVGRSVNDGAAALEALTASGTRFDGVLAAGGALAYGIAQATPQVAGRLGQDWNLIAGTDGPLVAGAGISALHWPTERWGALLTQYLVALLNAEMPPQRTLLNPSLVVRHS